ncbi:asparagine synthase-related protein [Microbacterium sp. zg-YB36]|uniref:asparagine synthase-related protein n=1 Tax=Microbacterium sp. zg-YB36 TaxID=2969407 RepID=UPI00214B6636|nr:asparagine synthase-related protein [Microbacterium sp. zg-YB36]MDL5352370.1 asparagine synthase-related protein [Microbacterium sp. zg-YB36]
MLDTALLPGFLAIRSDGFHRAVPAREDSTTTRCGGVGLVHWGVTPIPNADRRHPTLILSRVVRRTGGRVSDAEVEEVIRADPGSLTRLLPPFAAIAGDERGVRVVADSMGFRHLFHSPPGLAEGVALSSSALVAATAKGAHLDETAVGVQSLLGWQLGQRTLFEGVTKLQPGAVAAFDDRGVSITSARIRGEEPVDRRTAVVRAASLLRESLNALLDDSPDAVLQLTGGMDSRLLLSAIPTSRRYGLRAMTLDVPGKGDVAVARQLAARYGIRHEVRGLAEVAGVDPAEAWELCRAEATRLDAMSDPVGLAAQRIAERAFEQGVRISGLGGEVARGFYYAGRVVDRPFARNEAARLASWRMFVNEAVQPGLLTEEFAGWAREVAVDEVHAALEAGGPEWFRATDELYLRHRMQRWAGSTDTAVSAQRIVINPMLDPAFLDIAMQLRPQDKARSRFLGELQIELDPELAHIPLDGRPAPAAFAHPSRLQGVGQALITAKRTIRKAAQRVRRVDRAPAGGEVLAEKVVAHWRENPELISGLSTLHFIDQEYVQRVIDGVAKPRPSAVAFLTNLVVATGADG